MLNSNNFNVQEEGVIVDCNYTFEESIANLEFPKELKLDLKLVTVQYYSFNKKLHQGQIVVHKDLVKDVENIFKLIKEMKFKIGRAIPIVYYNWSDEKSMLDNNTSAFNYRFIAGTKKLSNHSTGRALDINPFLNPQVFKDKIYPSTANYDPKKEGTITVNSNIVKEFKRMGWTWGGDWESSKDYQHFEKLK